MTGKHFAHFKWVQWKKVDHFQRKSLLLLAFKSIMPVFLYPQKWPHDRNKQPLLWLLTLRSESVCSRSPIWSSIPILMVSRVSLTRFAVVTGWRGYCPISNREPINFEQIRISSPVNFDHNKTRSQVGGFFLEGSSKWPSHGYLKSKWQTSCAFPDMDYCDSCLSFLTINMPIKINIA